MIKTLLCDRWIDTLKQYKTLYVGFSGGLDSTVLLHHLVQSDLKLKVHAIHVHHGISPHADIWQKHCETICWQLGVTCFVEKITIADKNNIEANARKARYEAFASYITPNDALLLAHHADDQAETLLLQLFRGSGVDGAAAMPEKRVFASGHLLRPFLAHKRQELHDYANHYDLNWIDDESNNDTKYARNFIRHELLPLIQTRWPNIVDNLGRSAEHFKQAQNNLNNLAMLDCSFSLKSPRFKEEIINQSAVKNERNELFSIEPYFLTLSNERQCNALRIWLKSNQVLMPSKAVMQRIINELIFASEDAQPVVEWGGVALRRFKGTLYLEFGLITKHKPVKVIWSQFPKNLELEQGVLTAVPSQEGLQLPPGDVQITVEFRRGGEKFAWRGQTKSLKKLMQLWSIPPWLRDEVPLIVINDEIAAVVGYAISDKFWGATRPFQITIK